MKRLTTLQEAAVEYFYKRAIGMDAGLRPQKRVVNTMIKRGYLQVTESGKTVVSLEGIQYLNYYSNLPKMSIEMDEANVIDMREHESEKGWEVHRFAETNALATHINNLINFYGVEAVQWQMSRAIKKVA